MKALSGLVCLLTDFGLRGSYVGIMKGVLLSEAPDCRVIDLTYDVPPQNVRNAAFQLLSSYRFFPKGTLFLCVVDPGVGSNRRILYAEAGIWRFIAPDNGLLSWMFKETKPRRIFDISRGMGNPNRLGRTFHGRDVIAPIAARILKGESPAKFGKLVHSTVSMAFPSVIKNKERWQGEVLALDGFGNAITNFPAREVHAIQRQITPQFAFKRTDVEVSGVADSYSAVEKGAALAVAGSSGYIELSIRNGNLARTKGIKEGDPVMMFLNKRKRRS